MDHFLDYKKISQGLNLSQKETRNFLMDGRIMGRLGEFIVAKKLSGTRTNEGSYDVDCKDGHKIEVRSLTNKVCFASSSEIGSGRQVTEEGFLKKLDSLDYYIVIDFSKDKLKFHNVYKEDIEYMENRKMLNINKEIARDRFLNYMKSKDKTGAPAIFFTSDDEKAKKSSFFE